MQTFAIRPLIANRESQATHAAPDAAGAAYTNNWVPVGATPVYLVPTNNAAWLTWTIPDGGFDLQTNTVNPASAVSWSTNHGLPPAPLFRSQKALLLKPGDLPATKNLMFRMSRPGF